ncbi:hypothetical protein GCM10017673_16230 [Streptosporangium violaceochromogenes]|nr:hypothetical protein GCM10017673_16230 [Streptosporangium violaceochromogenes]
MQPRAHPGDGAHVKTASDPHRLGLKITGDAHSSSFASDLVPDPGPPRAVSRIRPAPDPGRPRNEGDEKPQTHPLNPPLPLAWGLLAPPGRKDARHGELFTEVMRITTVSRGDAYRDGPRERRRPARFRDSRRNPPALTGLSDRRARRGGSPRGAALSDGRFPGSGDHRHPAFPRMVSDIAA